MVLFMCRVEDRLRESVSGWACVGFLWGGEDDIFPCSSGFQKKSYTAVSYHKDVYNNRYFGGLSALSRVRKQKCGPESNLVSLATAEV